MSNCMYDPVKGKKEWCILVVFLNDENVCNERDILEAKRKYLKKKSLTTFPVQNLPRQDSIPGPRTHKANDEPSLY